MLKNTKYPKIKHLEEDSSILSQKVDVTEKIDGGNVSVSVNKGVLGLGTRSGTLEGRDLERYWFGDFNKWARSNPSLYNLPENVVMFGEWLAPHTINYAPKNVNKFYFLDLGWVDKDEDLTFFPYEEAVSYLADWGLDNVRTLPPIRSGVFTFEEIKQIRDGDISQLYDGQMEGVVLKCDYTGQRAKSLHPLFAEIREDAKTLEEKYITPQRIRKSIQRVGDGKQDLNSLRANSKLFEKVVDNIIMDIWQESGIAFRPGAVRLVARGVAGRYHR